jgi:hypothetical protein
MGARNKDLSILTPLSGQKQPTVHSTLINHPGTTPPYPSGMKRVQQTAY